MFEKKFKGEDEMNKQLKLIRCYSNGGNIDKTKMHFVDVCLEYEESLFEAFPVNPIQLTCSLSFKIGDVEIKKEFKEGQYPYLKEVMKSLNSINLDKITSKGVTAMDAPVTTLQYLYDGAEGEIKKLANPDGEGVLSIFEELINKLIEDEEIKHIINVLEK